MKKRVLLINPVVREWAQPNCFPTGLGYIAAVLDWAGVEVRVLDLNANRGSVLASIAEYNPEVVGITGIITQYAEVKGLTYICRILWPDTFIVCGGPLASSIPDLLLNRTGVDACVLGEGETTVVEMMGPKGFWNSKGLKIKGLDGVVYQSPEQDVEGNLEMISYPAYDKFPMEVYLNNPIAADNRRKWEDGKWESVRNVRRSINMIGTRGCPFDCSFCYHCYLGQGYRMRAPGDIIREMAMLRRRYKVEYIHFTDDAFACSPKFIESFCGTLRERKELNFGVSDITWSCAGRANVMTEELVAAMAEVGCEGLCFGLESGSQRMLDAMNKKATVEQYRRAIALNRKYFQYEDYTFIVGTPGEGWDTVRESVKFCRDEGVVPTAVFYMTPYPGTPLFNSLVEGDARFSAMVGDEDSFERFVLSLGEQGERMVWNCTDRPDEEVREWHQFFLEETGAWNRTRDSKSR